MMGWGWGGGWVMMLIWWAIIIGGLVLLIRWLISSRSQTSQSSRDTALDILRERYARGDINREEFEEKKKDLVS
ncbi:MAG: SHOCT domain-containing protein [Candidatus Zixiibacteriota bacterium]|nr:MAG: SHOCT domain-containing protein [candidate division Zixibacteria bacterium]